jgi:exodeoxyribonuclease-3
VRSATIAAVRIATWNVNSVTARLPRLLEWLQDSAPDALCVQETKVADFPSADVESLGYEVAAHGDGRWNGVAILSRVGLADVRRGLDGEPGYAPAASTATAQEELPLTTTEGPPPREARALAATCGAVRLWSVYVPNGREPGHEHYAYKLAWLAALRDTVAAELGESPLAVLGDFNVAPTDADVWDPAAFVGSTHVTPPERTALERLRALGLTDVLPRAMKHDTPFTYWDYRAGNFHKNFGMRIDLVYASASFAAHVRDSYVDRDARKGKGPSDHAPVVVDLDL